MKAKRAFLESLERSDSYIRVSVDKDTGELALKLSDCDRRIRDAWPVHRGHEVGV